MLGKRRQLAVKAEVTEGTAETLTAAEAKLLVYDLKLALGIEVPERRPVRRTLTQLTGIRGKGWAELSFSFDLRGEDTTADSVPAWGPIFQAAGFTETIVPATSVGYTPLDDVDTAPSLTAAVYLDGIVRKLRGCRVTSLGLELMVGGLWKVTATLRGVLVGAVDVAASMLAPTYPSALPFSWGAGTGTLGGINFTGTKVSLNAGIESSERYDVNLEHGCKSVGLTGRKWTGSLDVELVLPATKDYLSNLMANTTQAMNLVNGTGAGRVVTIAAPKLQLTGLTDADRDGMATWDGAFALVGAEAGEADEISITKT